MTSGATMRVQHDIVRNDTYAVGPPRVQLLLFAVYYHLRLISRIRHLLRQDACRHAAVRCLVLSRLDYCDGLLCRLNNGLTNRLLRVQNSAARLINRVRRRDHITPNLQSLHWLPIKMRVTFNICIRPCMA
ncbi:hypothetical protein NP493_165g06050 [Ridgeia piscesae]|uniref:Uncharacterized protein n=1 Tax=Ridgeia piscesae TaxID=27915 RepID=A0AAD9P3F7_RIDPI|nr:hypothetical protein NP493_165g06050 [Ridgeia piscesae]